MVPDDYLANLSYEEREGIWSRATSEAGHSSFVYVAEDEEGQVVGFASGGLNRTPATEYEGELYAIYLLEEHQGKGIGRHLASAVAKRLAQMGIHSMLVWVLKDNPACRFYEALGGEKVLEQEFELAGVTLTEIGYGWKESGVLTG
jgi:GNAT superfamily N-acetyltransferase